MALWNPFAKAEKRSLEDPRVPVSNVVAVANMFGYNSPLPPVSIERALGIPAIWCAVNVIADTLAGLPLQLFSRKDNSRTLDKKDGLYAILHDAPNESLHSFGWRKQMMTSVLTLGRSFTFIERNRLGRVMNLWLLDARKVSVARRNGRVLYHYYENGREITYEAKDIIDISFMLKTDGVGHYAPLSLQGAALPLSVALEEYAARFFLNGGVPPMQLVGPFASVGAASRASYDVQQNVMEASQQRKNILALPTGHELKSIGIDPEKSQMEKARRFQVEEAARIYQLPPSFLQDLTHGNFTNVEQQDLHFEKHCMHRWVKQVEQELNLKLFGRDKRDRFAEFNMDGLLRGDYKTRMEGYAVAIQNAINKPNEIRGIENWPDDPKGNDLLIQGATVPLGMQMTMNIKPPPKAKT